MTADIDTVLARLRERPECRDAVEVIERLTAERDRLREAIETHRASEPADAHHYDEDVRLWAALGESPVPDEPTRKDVPHCGAGHLLAVDHDHDNPDEWWSVCGRCGVEFGPFDSHDEAAAMGVTALPAVPSHPTGEERDERCIQCRSRIVRLATGAVVHHDEITARWRGHSAYVLPREERTDG